MKKVLSVCTAVLMTSLLLVACGSKAPQGEMKGKTAPVVARGSSASHRVVSFSFILDSRGFSAIKAALVKEIKKAKTSKNKERVKKLKGIMRAFKCDPAKTIKAVSVAGPFNGWKPREDRLASSRTGQYMVYSIKKEWEFSGEKEEYKFVFILNAGDDVVKEMVVWVPDPMAAETSSDPYGGKNSLLLIPGFKASDEKGTKGK